MYIHWSLHVDERLYNIQLPLMLDISSGFRLNIKTVFPRYGNSHVKNKTIARPKMVKQHLYIETPPSSQPRKYYWMDVVVVHFMVNEILISAMWDQAFFYTPPFNEVERGYNGFTSSVCLSVRLSVRLWTKSCPLCIFHSTSRIHFIFAYLIKQLQKVFRM